MCASVFITAYHVLPNGHRAYPGTGSQMYESIKREISNRNISIKKVFGLGTDGAAAMTGKKNGLTGQFLKENPHLSNTHCSAHRVALVSEQAAKNIKAINDFKDTVCSIYYYFKHSASRVNEMHEIQKILEEPTLKYREVHHIRWLSFYKALEAVVRTMDSLITFFATKARDEAKAKGMEKKIAQELFIKIAYSMLDWLKPIMALNLFFQKKDLNIADVKVNELLNVIQNFM